MKKQRLVQERHFSRSFSIECYKLGWSFGFADNFKYDIIRLVTGAIHSHLWLRKIKILTMISLSTCKESLGDLVESGSIESQFGNGLHIDACAPLIYYFYKMFQYKK